MISSEDGQKLLLLARKAIESVFQGKEVQISQDIAAKFSETRGCFVTIHKKSELRGCIGFPEAIFPLWEAIVKAAKAAGFEDHRFLPLQQEELEDIDLELSVLTKPELAKIEEYNEYIQKVRIGTDGLIIKGSHGSGLLLPQVATELGWDAKEFLEHLGIKAGLGKDAWQDASNKVYTFQAQVFRENKKTHQ